MSKCRRFKVNGYIITLIHLMKKQEVNTVRTSKTIVHVEATPNLLDQEYIFYCITKLLRSKEKRTINVTSS